jgi:DNA gyrase subunit B
VSERLVVDVWRGGRHHTQRYARAVPLEPLRDVGPADRTGTRIAIVPDPEIFEDPRWDREAIAQHLSELRASLPALSVMALP